MEKEKKGVRLDHISKIYKDPKTGKDFYAVKDTCLEIRPGSFVTLLGPSGCGKTTLLRMIAGFNSIEGGDIFFNEKRINDMDPSKRNIGMVFQNYAIFPHMTVRDNVAFGLKNRKESKETIQKETDEFMKLMHISEYADRMPDRLSGGQQQRVALARALVIKPDVLLMDEPLSNLDAKLRNQMRAEIIKLREKIDTTFIYVTHDQVEAMTLGDRIVIMRDGYIQQIGTPQEVFNHPANLFVAGFIGSPQMNFFENCQLTKTAGGYTLTVMGETVTLTAEQSAKLAAAGVESRSVTAGVRPVHISLGESGIPAEVDVSELMGSELHLHLAANGQDVVAVIPTANIDPGAYARHTAVKFGFDAKLVHLFDSDSEKNLI